MLAWVVAWVVAWGVGAHTFVWWLSSFLNSRRFISLSLSLSLTHTHTHTHTHTIGTQMNELHTHTVTGGEDASFVLPLDLGVFDGVGGE